MRKNKFLLYIYQIYKIAFIYPVLAATTIILGFLTVVMSYIHPKSAAYYIPRIWARTLAYITPIFVTIKGMENFNKKQSYVMVANHQSQYDIVTLNGWFPGDFKWVMKIQLKGIPVFGYSLYRLGHIFIDRSNHEAALASINDAKKIIRDGTSIVFFPEGTRSETGQLSDFKKGAFKLAIDMGLPILPVTMKGTRDILPSNSTMLFPGKATMIIHPPIDTSGYDDSNMPDLMAKTKSAINDGLKDYFIERTL